MGLNHIFHIPKKNGRPLYDFLFAAYIQRFSSPVYGSQCVSCQYLALYLISSDAGKLDGFSHIDFINHPPHPRMPVDRLQHSPCGGRRHHIIAAPFHLHLRAAEEGVISPQPDPYSSAHRFTPFRHTPFS